MNGTLRRKSILELLRKERSSNVQNLADTLGVSHMTVRRDLEKLATEYPIRQLHGAVLYEEKQRDNYTTVRAREEMSKEKQRIALKAAELVEEGDSIFLDAGSTGEAIAALLPDNKAMTVICYAFNVAHTLTRLEDCRLILAGGEYKKRSMVFHCEEGIQLIGRHRTKRAFITASGISQKLGVTCSYDYEARIKRLAIDSSLEAVLVADSSKFGEIRSGYFSELTDFSIIISDKNLERSFQEEIAELGIQLILA